MSGVRGDSVNPVRVRLRALAKTFAQDVRGELCDRCEYQNLCEDAHTERARGEFFADVEATAGLRGCSHRTCEIGKRGPGLFARDRKARSAQKKTARRDFRFIRRVSRQSLLELCVLLSFLILFGTYLGIIGFLPFFLFPISSLFSFR